VIKVFVVKLYVELV